MATSSPPPPIHRRSYIIVPLAFDLIVFIQSFFENYIFNISIISIKILVFPLNLGKPHLKIHIMIIEFPIISHIGKGITISNRSCMP